MSFVNPIRRIVRGPKTSLLFVIWIPAVVLTLVVACDDNKKVTPPPDPGPYLDQSSAVNVLENLKTAYERREPQEYAKLFATDFVYFFSPADLEDPQNPTPELWGWTDEMTSADQLFTDSRVEGIALDWVIGDPTEDGPLGWKIRVDEVLLDIMTRNESNEVWILQVHGAAQVFHFREETVQTPAGRNRWVCTRWEDPAIGFARTHGMESGSMVEETTWGQIKHRYNTGASMYRDPSSAAGVLANLKRSYVTRAFVEYEKLFSADFVFLFDPADVEDPINPTPPQWARADEMDATENLFTHERVEGISLNWSVEQPEPDDVHSWKVRVDDVLLDVQTRNEIGEIWIFQVKGATHRFYFREGTEQTLAGRNKWVCTRWEDSPIGFARTFGTDLRPAVERTSWGQIKAHYR